MSQYISRFFSDIDNEPELISGKITDSHTIQWNKSIESNFPVLLNSWYSNNALTIRLKFDYAKQKPPDAHTNVTRIIFSIPITGLNIKESMVNDLTILTVTLKARQANTIFSKVTGSKYYGNVNDYEMGETYTLANDKEINVKFVIDEKNHSLDYPYSVEHTMATGLVVAGIGLIGLLLFSLYKLGTH